MFYLLKMVWFYGISNIVGYFMPDLFLHIYMRYIYIFLRVFGSHQKLKKQDGNKFIILN